MTLINLDDYKDKQMRRRLTTYVGNSGIQSVAEFCSKLEDDKAYLRKLLDFLTINVSEFFRDIHLFNKLESVVLPDLIKNNRDLKIWSAGCSRGQEPYTIAMMLESQIPKVHYRILATDIDEGALRYARAGGPYTKEDIRNIPEKFINRHITKKDDKFVVKPGLQERIEFQQQNLLRDRFEVNFDLIICRNVTIYFTEEAKHALNIKFHQSLKDNGTLFIGGTEVMLDAQKIGFSSIGACFYRKQPGAKIEKATPVMKVPVNA